MKPNENQEPIATPEPTVEPEPTPTPEPTATPQSLVETNLPATEKDTYTKDEVVELVNKTVTKVVKREQEKSANDLETERKAKEAVLLEKAKLEAITDNDIPKEWQGYITGDTKEEIEQSAKNLKEKLSPLLENKKPTSRFEPSVVKQVKEEQKEVKWAKQIKGEQS